jgi:hypothetical protein
VWARVTEWTKNPVRYTFALHLRAAERDFNGTSA